MEAAIVDDRVEVRVATFKVCSLVITLEREPCEGVEATALPQCGHAMCHLSFHGDIRAGRPGPGVIPHDRGTSPGGGAPHRRIAQRHHGVVEGEASRFTIRHVTATLPRAINQALDDQSRARLALTDIRRSSADAVEARITETSHSR